MRTTARLRPQQILLHNGRQLRDEQTLGGAGVSAGATLSVAGRLRGGGGDGGSTGAESRSCYLEMYAEKKPDKVGDARPTRRASLASCSC